MKHSFIHISSYILVFLSGMSIFIIEILGSRIIGPYLGSSLYTWTALIAVVLFFITVGSIVWGYFADKHSFHKLIQILSLSTAVFFVFLLLFASYISRFIVSFSGDIRFSSLILASILFGPIIFVLAGIFPVVTKRDIVDLSTDGYVIGKLSMISTYGSLLGIWLGIFVMIPLFGLDGSLVFLTGIFLLIAIYYSLYKIKLTIIYTLFLLGIILFLISEKRGLEQAGIYTFDTLYSRINIMDERVYGGYYRRFIVDTRILSEYNLITKDLTPYIEENFYIFQSFISEFKDILMLGGGGYTFPTEFVSVFPEVKIDVVEIDAQMEKISQEYFFLQESPNLHIIHTDGRYYLNTSEKKYDVILSDAFSGLRTTPFQLTTIEAVQAMYNRLNDDGVVVENLISAIEGENATYLYARYATFKEVFDEVYVYAVSAVSTKEESQNIFLVALKGNTAKGKNETYKHELLLREFSLVSVVNTPLILTDDYAPVEYIVAPMNRQIRHNSINSFK